MARAKLAGVQDGFTFDEPIGEDAAYLKQQLITYIGNKRTLLGPIGEAVEAVRDRLGQPRLRILDAFSGSGVVARSFKRSATELIVNDIEAYSGVIGRCYLTNRCDYPEGAVSEAISRLNALVDCGEPVDGLFSRLYAPANEDAITPNDRVFYTRENARRLDGYRQLIGLERLEVRDWLLGPLLSEASIHANTAGVFKGFYKDTATGLGSFGGSGANALDRIRGQIRLSEPVLSAYDSQVEVFQEEANSLVSKVGDLDLAYFDPPYNQHPYGSNYFMLNLLVQYQEPTEVSRVSGIPVDWQRSGYNVRAQSLPLISDLVERTDAKFILLSYNDEGFINIEDMRSTLSTFGKLTEVQIAHATFRGSRNLRNRSLAVTEHLFLLERR